MLINLQTFSFFSQCNFDFKDSVGFDLTNFHQDHKTVIKALENLILFIIYLQYYVVELIMLNYMSML